MNEENTIINSIKDFVGPYFKKAYELANRGSYAVMNSVLKKLSKTAFLHKIAVGKIILRFVRNAQKKLDVNKELAFPILIALAYFVMPIDLIADFIPVVGYIDDAYVMMMVFSFLDDKDDVNDNG